ncbi:MlaD family protein [Nocardia sp. NBC_01388]|uniref:MlaD family protein n=1 Tax=Nocardia sp. NBC_01388 TaxID=2903596 RepID=UPI0032478024
MLNKVLGSRGLLSFSMIVLVVVALTVGFRIVQDKPEMRGYCALMPDAIGLYKGSAVTVRGVPIGQVTRVTPAGAQARVEFELSAEHIVPPDAGATTLSDTLIADRRLAVVGADDGAVRRDSSDCITKTVTPKSLTETFTALSRLADQLNGANDPDQSGAINGGLRALSAATASSGDQINQIVRGLGTALNSPDAAIGHLGDLIDALASISRSANNGWSDIRSLMTRLTDTLYDINDVALPPIIEVLDKAADLLPALNDITKLAGPGLRSLDSVENLPQLIGAGLSSLRELLGMLPVFAGAFTQATDPVSGRLGLSYTAPHTQLSEPVAGQVCSALNALSPGACPDPAGGLAGMDLSSLVLASVVAR